jgi:CubicO group peptidase (beta-lactamase class C family)
MKRWVSENIIKIHSKIGINIKKMKTNKFLLIYGLVFLSIFNLVAQPSDKLISGMSLTRLERYENFIKSEMTQNKIPGAVALIMRNGRIVQEAAYGYRDAVNKTSMKSDDLFYMQSMTKPIMTVAFMMLYEEGHFLLTDPVSKYIPAFKTMRVSKDVNAGMAGETDSLASAITIAQVLSHTSGLTHGLGANALERDFRQTYYGAPFPKDVQGLVERMTKIPMMGQPGKQWNYSAGPDVLSALIEKFSGMSTNDFLNERLFKPLGMVNTGYNLSDAQAARVVKVHGAGGVLAPNQPQTKGQTIWFGSNALYSTAQDYLEFCQMLMSGGTWKGKEYLSRKTIELMTSDHVGTLYSASRPGEGFGLGFAVVTDMAKTKLLGSEGLFYWSGANNTHFFIDPKEKLISIFLTQQVPFNNFYHVKMRQMVYQAIAD